MQCGESIKNAILYPTPFANYDLNFTTQELKQVIIEKTTAKKVYTKQCFIYCI